jgi:3-oxoacyl-[acyl-carrier-protein] synthase II
VIEAERFQPYTVHPLPEIDWNLQIAKRGDQRQMETWQRLGTYGRTGARRRRHQGQ